MSAKSEDLTQYLLWVNETRQTMKIGSEQFMMSPPFPVLRANDRFVRRLISTALPAIEPSEELLDRLPFRMTEEDLRSWYWGEARRGHQVALEFGAASHAQVDDYFEVDVTRAWHARVGSLRQSHPEPSLTTELLRVISATAERRSTSMRQACRAALVELSRAWSRRAVDTETETESSMSIQQAVREASNGWASNHDHGRHGRTDHASHDMPSFPLSASEGEVSEFAGVCALGRLDFRQREMELAQVVARDPRVQFALLAFHGVVTVQARAMAAHLVAEYGDPQVLLPFTEICVDVNRYRSSAIDLVPNPKLLTVLANNIIPGISGAMLRDHVPHDQISGSVIQKGVASAVSRGIFEVRIGAFNRREQDGVATLDGMTQRVCPARDPFAQMCQTWLAFLFDRYPSRGRA